MNNAQRQSIQPFQHRRPFIPPYNWFPREADLYRPPSSFNNNAIIDNDTSFYNDSFIESPELSHGGTAAQLIPEADVFPFDNFTISSLHSMTKNIIKTLQTIDKTLDLVSKVFSNKTISAGTNPFKILSNFIGKVDINKLERAVEIIQSPLIIDMLTSGLNFNNDETSETAEHSESTIANNESIAD